MKRVLSIMVVLLAFAAVVSPLAFASDAPPVAAAPVAVVDLTPIVEAVILLAASLITGFLIPWIKTKRSAEELKIAISAIRTAVYGAEEMYKSGNGDKKLEYVKNYLAAKGFKVDVTQIKAAVKKMRDDAVFSTALETAGLIKPEDDEPADDQDIDDN